MKCFWVSIFVLFLASQLGGCRGESDYVNADDLVKNNVKVETTTTQTIKVDVAGSGDEQGESRSMYGGMSSSGERCPSPNYRPTGSYHGNYQQQQGYPYQGPPMGNNNMGMGGGYPSYGMQGGGGMPMPPPGIVFLCFQAFSFIFAIRNGRWNAPSYGSPSTQAGSRSRQRGRHYYSA